MGQSLLCDPKLNLLAISKHKKRRRFTSRAFSSNKIRLVYRNCSGSVQWFSQDSLLRLLDSAMGFIMEFAENLILRLMEDPNERDNKWRKKMYDRFENCKRTKEMWSYPLKPYGFWTFDRFNAQIFWDAQISQVAGRRDPYDDLIEEHSKPSSSK